MTCLSKHGKILLASIVVGRRFQVTSGVFRPVYEMVYNHYVNRKRGSMKYTKEVIDKIRPEGYYYEHFGFGTFLFNDKAK